MRKEKKMIVKPNLNDSTGYVGPRAIYDPNFVPPRLLFPKKEINTLSSILRDSISDKFCFNALYQGIQGIGKKVIAKKVIDDISRCEGRRLSIIKFKHDKKNSTINKHSYNFRI